METLHATSSDVKLISLYESGFAGISFGWTIIIKLSKISVQPAKTFFSHKISVHVF